MNQSQSNVTDIPVPQMRLIKAVESLLTAVQQGEIKGLLVIVEGEDSFNYSRINMSAECALGFMGRISYRINQDFDKAKR